MQSRRNKIFIIAGISIIGVAAIIMFQASFLYAQPADMAHLPALTRINQSLEPHSTVALHHPVWSGQVMDVRIEPSRGEEHTPDYELLITMVDPDGYTIFSKFIKEPFAQKFAGGREGWYAIIITNVGNTTIGSGDRIESRAFDASVDSDARTPLPCIVPPSLKNENNTPFPWC